MKKKTFNKSYLLNEFATYKKMAEDFSKLGQLEKSLKSCFFAARIAYHYPILYNFVDEHLENTLQNISCKILKDQNTNSKPNYHKKIVFYDTQIIDSSQLTEHFLDYFIKNNFEVLFIVSERNKTIYGTKILKKINASNQISLFIPSDNNFSNRIIETYKEILIFKPSHAFIQMKPDDIMGFSVFANLKNIKTYYLDITGHTFWIGKTIFNYFIEIFQSYWLTSIKRRGIDISKLIYLHIYPIIDKNVFEGFPFDRKNKIIGLSGGQIYKYLADPELNYFKVIARLLKENENFIFCLAGGGMPTIKIEKFILENELQTKFYLLGKRSDFYELVGKSDIFFESYPIKGGLTPLFSIENKKPIVGMVGQNSFSLGLEHILDLDTFNQVESLDEFYEEATLLIRSSAERKKNVSRFDNCKKTKYYFELGLDDIMLNKKYQENPIINYELKFDDENSLEEYVNIDNAEFNYYLEKLYFTWSCLNWYSRISTFGYLILTIRKKSTFNLILEYCKYYINVISNKKTNKSF